ncbi:hypothetical protein JHJ32_01715 [Parapedobacter sp. ISTM3]|uniref:DUF6055 domain-containing protein n=1 Tax=Parapedobacter sp. ISTM3 TaxID=2800130 RepID=UPI0019079D17|nr:DUF6055 domain-containing protein [Parapedobacter sp. ISTM3]MBK1438694.1 hypothetical protein [Parapedobacter sp. ISTM3]
MKMKRSNYLLKGPTAVLVVLLLSYSAYSQSIQKKERYIPQTVYRVPEGNDYSNDSSEFSYKRMIETPNFAAFWAKEYGDDPMANPDTAKRFDLAAALAEGERFYNYFIDTLKFADRGRSWSDKYKILIYVIGSEDGGGTAFGGGSEHVGIFWAPPARINQSPYGTFAHELGHSFQFLVRADGANGAGGSMAEMTSQYMLWQVYPEWMTFENYHLKSFMEKTHYAFLHPTNMYHSPYVLEYWSSIHGKDMVARLWRESREGEDAVMTYKRLTGIGQQAFNDELFDACRRFITWDMDRIREVASPYANQHHTSLVDVGNGWYRIDSAKCPQNYGYNGIELAVPKSGTTVKLQFKELAGSTGYSVHRVAHAGWRYGFVAYKENGERVYGKIQTAADGKAKFKVPEGTKHLWLVVMGAPEEHWSIPMRRRGQQAETAKEEQWPYQIKLVGTTVL